MAFPQEDHLAVVDTVPHSAPSFKAAQRWHPAGGPSHQSTPDDMQGWTISGKMFKYFGPLDYSLLSTGVGCQEDENQLSCLQVFWPLITYCQGWYQLVLQSPGLRRFKYWSIILYIYMAYARGGICHSRHCRRQCKIFASGVNFSIFTHFLCFFPLTLLK